MPFEVKKAGTFSLCIKRDFQVWPHLPNIFIALFLFILMTQSTLLPGTCNITSKSAVIIYYSLPA